ncbi:DUF4865 family protein [Actinoallomurus vinaceus]|uniref:DUF4865 family protein n=1 Tax=Actinoallomurus vinaceus TaxID=1080074 RepID=A0ABP8UKG0_9ACTN
MYAMQYEITLPADYDMKIIRERVATRGRATDDFQGLGLKAFLMRERGVGGSPVNQYAPFYLWDSVDGMNRFLWGGGGFRGIVDDFGRPAVRHWTGAAFERGPAYGATPRAATRRTEPVPAGADPEGVVASALEELGSRTRTDGVHATALAVDPGRWELVHFTLWADSPAAADEDRYEVLHLSTPDLHELTRGRQW